MYRRILLIASTLVFAFAILFTSVLRTASVKYVFSQETEIQEEGQESESMEIDYVLPYPGRISPDSPLWPIKALRDRLWLMLTSNLDRKAELKLLFADKRLAMSKILFERDKAEIAFSTLTKAEKYLEEACAMEQESRQKGTDTSAFLTTLSKASLKHRQIIDEILTIAPEDAKPGIGRVQDYSKETYNKTRNALLEKGMPIVENPFESE
jgi:lambda repressor-like predicted transcriptional regulator